MRVHCASRVRRRGSQLASCNGCQFELRTSAAATFASATCVAGKALKRAHVFAASCGGSGTFMSPNARLAVSPVTRSISHLSRTIVPIAHSLVPPPPTHHVDDPSKEHEIARHDRAKVTCKAWRGRWAAPPPPPPRSLSMCLIFFSKGTNAERTLASQRVSACQRLRSSSFAWWRRETLSCCSTYLKNSTRFHARLERGSRRACALLRESQRTPLALHRPRLAAQLADRLRLGADRGEQLRAANRPRRRRCVVAVARLVDGVIAASTHGARVVRSHECDYAAAKMHFICVKTAKIETTRKRQTRPSTLFSWQIRTYKIDGEALRARL